jgi:hypothetical protein
VVVHACRGDKSPQGDLADAAPTNAQPRAVAAARLCRYNVKLGQP